MLHIEVRTKALLDVQYIPSLQKLHVSNVEWGFKQSVALTDLCSLLL